MEVVVRCVCREPYNDGNLVKCEKCGLYEHEMCVGQDAGPCFRCVKDDERTKRRTRKREAPAAAQNKKRRVPSIADHPECFYNEISHNEFGDGVFGRDLPKAEAPQDFPIEIRRVSQTFSMAAFGLFTLEPIRKGAYCAEVLGKIDWLQHYKDNIFNQYKLMGCPKPGVLFVQNMVVDCRVRGNYGAFVQHSARPNCAVRAVSQNGTLRILIQALGDLAADTMLTVGWTWDPSHPIHKPLQSLGPAQLARIDKSLARLREFGLVGGVQDFLPDHRDRESRRTSTAFAATAGSAGSARAATDPAALQPDPQGPVLAEFVWKTPQPQAAVEEAPKKRLSLADYKKKRPVMG